MVTRDKTYANGVAYMRSIFTKRLAKYTDEEVRTLAANTPAFSDVIYGKDSGMGLGNTQPGDGYKYRGRGFVQLTGRDAYQRATTALGIDFINNPELVNNPVENAADTAVWEIKTAFKIICPRAQWKLDPKNPQPKSQEDANVLVLNAVGGAKNRLARPVGGYFSTLLADIDKTAPGMTVTGNV